MQGEKEGKDKAKEKEKEKEKERVAKLAALFGAKTHTIEQDEQSSIEDTKVLFLFLFFFIFASRQQLMSWLSRLCHASFVIWIFF